MKWLRYPLQAITMLSDLFMVACVVVVFLCMPFPWNVIFGIGSIFWLRWIGRGKGEMPLFWSWKSKK